MTTTIETVMQSDIFGEEINVNDVDKKPGRKSVKEKNPQTVAPIKPSQRSNEIVEVNVVDLHEHPLNEVIYPSVNDAETVNQLQESISRNGLIQQVVCTRTKEGEYIILVGHLRVRAFRGLVLQGHSEYSKIKVGLKFFESDDAILEYMIEANVTTRHKSEYSKLVETGLLSDLYQKRKVLDQVNKGVTEIKYVSEKMGICTTQAFKYLENYKKIGLEKFKEIIENNPEITLNELFPKLKSGEVDKAIKSTNEEAAPAFFSKPLNKKVTRLVTNYQLQTEKLLLTIELLSGSDILSKTGSKQLMAVRKQIEVIKDSLVQEVKPLE